jgi:hypothetical protein
VLSSVNWGLGVEVRETLETLTMSTPRVNCGAAFFVLGIQCIQCRLSGLESSGLNFSPESSVSNPVTRASSSNRQ